TPPAAPPRQRRKRKALARTAAPAESREESQLPAGETDWDELAEVSFESNDDVQAERVAMGTADAPALRIIGARQNNLKDIDVTIPLGRFVCVTGVSGSGKSSLVTDILHPALAHRLHRATLAAGVYTEIRGIEHLDKVINVDQAPIGNSPLSNPATYTGLFDHVRELFAKLPDSKVRGYTANRFSFNRAGGRCDACDGLGQVCYEMHFLPDVWVTCETCGGARYNRETLEVRYKGRNIADVLNLTVAEALALFDSIPRIKRVLRTLSDVGLDYMPLGQSAPTLSGGEAQRVKLAAELGRPDTGRTIYILDEPTTGLHLHDLRKLLDVLHRLVDLGNTVVCIEHNLDVIKTADRVIDLGPEAGDAGGKIVAEGTPEQIAAARESHTGRALSPVLRAGPQAERPRFDAARHEMPAVSRADEGALELQAAETEAGQMPWQRDGRRWHLEQRPSRGGEKVEWEGAALAYVVSRIEKLGHKRLEPTNWNDRACVEIRAALPRGTRSADVPWFMHALTGGRWLLELSFRVPRGTFDDRRLVRQLNLKPLDQRDDLPVYGSDERVFVRPVQGDWENVRVLVHDRAEVDHASFRRFLADSLKAHLGRIARVAEDRSEAEPWRTNGRAWHLGQKGMAPGEPPEWNASLLIDLLGRINRAAPRVTPDWNHKTHVRLVVDGKSEIGRVYTCHARGLKVRLGEPPGKFSVVEATLLRADATLRRGLAGKPDILEFQLRNGLTPNWRLFATFVVASADNGIGIRT
ncbi:MAG: ATP-binding cassette domain-containing protein, partial [Phycisphaerae bacterium]|nr:ATP-binding cassette domain-containing protein [Phycisphaerae bacterium]